MQNIIHRRTFVRNTLAQVAIIGVGASLASAASAAEDPKDVKFARNPASPQPGLEAAHAPSITLEKMESKEVAYGKTAPGSFYRVSVQARHEAIKDHHIFGLALYLNGELVAEHTMNPARAEASLPVAAFFQRLQTGDTLMAVTSCNLHGKWGSKATV